MFPLSTPLELQLYAEADLPTEYGVFQAKVYRDVATGDEHVAMVCGSVAGSEPVLVRVHSECMTGEVFHSRKCDCREQLELALQRVAKTGRGVVVYLRQEGRGIGLGNKLRAYALQQDGLDTIDANRALGFGDDLRRYDAAVAILRDLGIRAIDLMTNNPLKKKALEDASFVVRRVEHCVAAHEGNRNYLVAKRDRLGHLLEGCGSTLSSNRSSKPEPKADLRRDRQVKDKTDDSKAAE